MALNPIIIPVARSPLKSFPAEEDEPPRYKGNSLFSDRKTHHMRHSAFKRYKVRK